MPWDPDKIRKCGAVNSAGLSCRRPAGPDGFCRSHAATRPGAVFCKGTTVAGKPCTALPMVDGY